MQQQPDDPFIRDTDVLWRTCLDLHNDAEGPRIKSSVFKTDGDGEISVDVGCLTSLAETFLRAPADHQYLAEIDAQLPRSFEISLGEDKPTLLYTVYLWDDGSGNRAHAHIHPPAGIGTKAYEKRAKIMAKRARIKPRP
jgi:hypothetical protein